MKSERLIKRVNGILRNSEISSKCKKNAFRYGISIAWREQKNHRKHSISCSNLYSAIRSIHHSTGISKFKPTVTVKEMPISDEGEIIPEQNENQIKPK